MEQYMDQIVALIVIFSAITLMLGILLGFQVKERKAKAPVQEFHSHQTFVYQTPTEPEVFDQDLEPKDTLIYDELVESYKNKEYQR